MTDVRAFRAIHYNQTKVTLDDVTAPPYDVISLDQQSNYYEKSPFNIVRLDFGKILATDTEQDNRYTRTAAYLTDWRRQEVLIKDEEPGVYVYRQTFQKNGVATSVTGIICLVKLTDFGEDVLPHEKTLAAPKEDRRRLIESCEANFSQVFALYSDHSGTVDGILAAAAAGSADQETTDEEGVVHQVWTLASNDQIDLIRDALADRRLVIADGHHRYETSLNFMKDMRAAGKARDSFDYIMMYLVDMVHENLLILPTHRLIKTEEFNLDAWLRNLGSTYDVEEVVWEPRTTEELSIGEREVRFGLYADNRFFRLRADRKQLADSLPGSHSPAWKSLDTALLQETVLGPHLGISSGDARLSFTQDAVEAVNKVDSGQADAALLLEPMLINQVEAVAATGEKMPQKSTYFYPKPRTGLILRDLD